MYLLQTNFVIRLTPNIMSKINQQIQRAAERYKERENNVELKEDLLSILTEINNLEEPEAKTPLTIGDMASERLEQLINTDAMQKQIIKTGFEDYDEEFGGLLKGELTIIGGRPGMGKTQFVVTLCTNIAAIAKPVAYISLELSNFLVSNRFIGNLSKVSSRELLKGDLKEQEEFNVKAAVTKLNHLPIYVYDQYQSSIFSILERCRQLVSEQKVEAIFIDYLQLITANSKRFNREAELGLITRELKKLAKELGISIVATSQLSRNVENRPGGSKRPQLSDLRESGAIEQDADKVIFLYRPEYYGIEIDENNEPTRYVMEVIIAKNKSGTLDTIKLMTEKYFTGFKKYTGPFSDLNISDDRMNDLN